MFGKKPIPVYLFTGFLDGGKTSFIRQTMDEGQFKDGRRTLYIVCEEGEEEIDEKRLKENDFVVKVIEDEDDVTVELLEAFDKEVKPGRVIIEANGLWDVDEMLDAMPKLWQLAEVVTPVDSTTFESYLANMKMMMTNQFSYSDLVIFNRCSEEYDRAMFKRMVRAVNRGTQVLYETLEGKVEDNVPEEMPFDKEASVIEIEDDDFGIFYIDILDHLDTYVDKKVRFKALTFHPKNFVDKNTFVLGRNAMTCCAEDISFVGLPAEYDEQDKYKNNEWVMVTATINAVVSKQDNTPIPLIVVENLENAQAPKEETVYFY